MSAKVLLRYVVVPALLALCGAWSPSYGDSVTRAVTNATTISDGSGNSRVLFDAGVLTDLGSVAVSRATLIFTLSGSASEGRCALYVHPVTTSWTSGVSWSSGWSRAGGDFDGGVYGVADVDLGRTATVSIDVTAMMKEIVEHGLTAYGFLVTADSQERTGLTSAEVSRLNNLSGATVEIKYRKVPPKPRGA